MVAIRNQQYLLFSTKSVVLKQLEKKSYAICILQMRLQNCRGLLQAMLRLVVG